MTWRQRVKEENRQRKVLKRLKEQGEIPKADRREHDREREHYRKISRGEKD